MKNSCLEKKNGNDLYSKTGNAGFNNYTKYGFEMHQLYPSVMDYPALKNIKSGVEPLLIFAVCFANAGRGVMHFVVMKCLVRSVYKAAHSIKRKLDVGF